MAALQGTAQDHTTSKRWAPLLLKGGEHGARPLVLKGGEHGARPLVLKGGEHGASVYLRMYLR